MAGNKVNTKTKGKEDRAKSGKGLNQNNEEGEEMDFSMLRKPVPTSITGFAQARKIFDFATEELKDLLTNECDLLYECKVCRNIFRSLANFISHKRVYCKEKFSTSLHGHFVNINSTAKEIQKIKSTEEGYQEALKEKPSVNREEEENDDRVPLTKDITAVYEKIMKIKGVYAKNEEPQVSLQKIPSSSVAVFQNMKREECEDKMRAQVNELEAILSRDKAVLQSDGKFKIESSYEANKQEQDNVIQISDDEDDNGDTLRCKICGLQFSTQKTLKFHMKYKHLASRVVYPCPDCLDTFATSWSVYRHLFKVHRKTAAQIRRLRESIQAKAFKMNNPPAFYQKKKSIIEQNKKMTEEERLDQENQEWMDNMEGDGEVPRCGGCGRSFERRAALAAHTHTCQPRCRALARRPDTKKIEIQIRKDYNKTPVSGLSIIKAVDSHDNKSTEDEPSRENEKPKVEDEAPPENEDKDMDDAPMDIGDDELKSNDSSESPEKSIEQKLVESYQPVIRLPFAMHLEKSNLAAFRQRILPDMEFNKLLCKKCDSTHASHSELFDHMAEHFKWLRYACKLCNFKHYDFDQLPEHVRTVHKLKGDKDFYYSTVKAIDGTEAMILSKCLTESEPTDDVVETNDASSDSRRPSRCSSDSSRLSDESSSSNTVKEIGSRKRKMHNSKNNSKKKKDVNEDADDSKSGELSMDKVLKSIIGADTCSASHIKSFEENSSDMDDIEDRISKRQLIEDIAPVMSRRPVRKRTKPKHEDFEYDLSNLLKMEAQGYRDSQTTTTTTKPTQTTTNSKTTVAATNTKTSQSVTTTKATQPKKKVSLEANNVYETLNKDCYGALMTMSKASVEKAAAAMKTEGFTSIYSSARTSSVFVRPTMLPRIMSRSDKSSPKKDAVEDLKDSIIKKAVSVKNEVFKQAVSVKDDSKATCSDNSKNIADTPDDRNSLQNVNCRGNEQQKALPNSSSEETNEVNDSNKESQNGPTSHISQEHNVPGDNYSESTDISSKILSTIPAVVPLTFRRQSMEIIKNPIINKNLTDFTKAGMKTKILVIKPINRNKDGTKIVNSSSKFQTIKLKDVNKSGSDDSKSDQVMVVKVPTVPCTTAATVSEKPSIIEPATIENDKCENNCDSNENSIVFENKTQVQNDVGLVEEVVTTNSDANVIEELDTTNSENVSDIAVKDSIDASDKSESIES